MLEFIGFVLKMLFQFFMLGCTIWFIWYWFIGRKISKGVGVKMSKEQFKQELTSGVLTRDSKVILNRWRGIYYQDRVSPVLQIIQRDLFNINAELKRLLEVDRIVCVYNASDDPSLSWFVGIDKENIKKSFRQLAHSEYMEEDEFICSIALAHGQCIFFDLPILINQLTMEKVLGEINKYNLTLAKNEVGEGYYVFDLVDEKVHWDN